MKCTISFLALSLLALNLVNTAAAQTGGQTVTINFPQKAAIAVSGDPAALTLSNVTVTQSGGSWAAVSSGLTTLSQVNNFGTGNLYITANADFASINGAQMLPVPGTLTGTWLTLDLSATFSTGSSGMGLANVDLSDGQGHNIVTGLGRGFSKFNLQYHLSATDAAQAFDEIQANVTFTVTSVSAP